MDNYYSDYNEGDVISFVGGTDEYSVRGHAKTQPKIIIEVDGEAVYVPISCVRLVRRAAMTTSAKLEHAKSELHRLLKVAYRVRGGSTHYVNGSELCTLLKELER